MLRFGGTRREPSTRCPVRAKSDFKPDP